MNSQIFEFYRDTVIPSIAKEGDDGNYGSAAVRDVEVLSALSRRIHFGGFGSDSLFSFSLPITLLSAVFSNLSFPLSFHFLALNHQVCSSLNPNSSPLPHHS